MHWNAARYNAKINSLYKTVVASGNWDPPDIVALCEIEHKSILEDLIYHTYLSKYDYGIIHEESHDRRGIDVCLIYRKRNLFVMKYKYLVPLSDTAFNSRSSLYLKFCAENDTISLFVNHWPSRRGGVLAGEDNRIAISSVVRDMVDSILQKDVYSKIILTGDFNCTPHDELIKKFVNRNEEGKSLKNLADSLDAAGRGTYRYLGTWELIDQVMVSNGLLFNTKGFITNTKMFQICSYDFLLKKDEKYAGFSPYPTYRGYRYAGGYSDHLPVVLKLNFR
jgi:endonuclease/exonuclease/phosphatase family metal-dependent hydrolase